MKNRYILHYNTAIGPFTKMVDERMIDEEGERYGVREREGREGEYMINR